jgi:hypothetical protein
VVLLSKKQLRVFLARPQRFIMVCGTRACAGHIAGMACSRSVACIDDSWECGRGVMGGGGVDRQGGGEGRGGEGVGRMELGRLPKRVYIVRRGCCDGVNKMMQRELT